MVAIAGGESVLEDMGISKIYFADSLKPINKSALRGVSFKMLSKKGRKKQEGKAFDRKRNEGRITKAQNRASIRRVEEYERKVAAGEIIPRQFDESVSISADTEMIALGMSIAREMKKTV